MWLQGSVGNRVATDFESFVGTFEGEMENKRAILISLICFSISMMLIWGYVQVRENELTSTFGEYVDVVVADGPFFQKEATDFIPEYTTITNDMVRVEHKMFKSFKQPPTVSKVEDVIGKATFVAIGQGEQVTLTKLVNPDGKPVLDRQVERKMRAVTIMVSPQSGVGRLIRPGNRVDVLIAPLYDSGGATQVEVKTLFQNVTVLATGKHIQNEVPTRVDRDLLTYIEEANNKLKRKDLFGGSPEQISTSRPDDNYTHVTLQLTTEDAEKLIYLSHKFGDRAVYLTLRNSADPEIAKIQTTLLDDVLGPDSDFGRSKIKPPAINPPKPRYNDILGGQQIPRY
jgi:pilus assembly protein CpaB